MSTFSLEGSIGSGKSYLLNLLNRHQISSFTEPLEDWTNYHSENILHKYYNNPSKYSFSFQTLVQLSMVKIYTNLKNLDSSKSFVVERSLDSAIFVFNELNNKHNNLEKVE